MTYSVVSTVSPPSVIHHALKCKFINKNEYNLILVKSNIIEVYNLSQISIEPIFKINLFGRIVSLQKYRPIDEHLDQLIILTEKYQLITLRFDPDTYQILTNSKLNLSSPYGRPNQNKSFCIIDQSHKLCLVSIYQGDLGLIWFDGGNEQFEKNYNKPSTSSGNRNTQSFLFGEITNRQRMMIEQFDILDICFLNQSKYPTIAILYSDFSGSLFVKFYQLSKNSSKMTEVYGEREVDSRATRLIPLPQGGLIVLGGSKIAVYNQKYSQDDQLCVNLADFHEFTCFDIIDQTRCLVGESKGKLHLIHLTPSKLLSGQLKCVDLHHIGYVSAPKTITYLDNRFVFIGSSSGDSQIWKLPYKSKSFELFQTFNNLGPITDIKYLKLHEKGPASLICTSGIGKDGSIRLITNGSSWDKKLQVPIGGIMKIYTFKKLNLIAMLFVNDIKLLCWHHKTQELEALNSITIDSSDPTILMVENDKGSIVHVTQSKIQIYTISNSLLHTCYTWSHPNSSKISLSCGDKDRLVIVDELNTLYYFKLIGDSLNVINQYIFDRPISFIELIDCPEFKNCCIISNWNQSSVSLFNLKQSFVIDTIVLPDLDSLPSLITSAKVASFNSLKFLFIGLSDGGCLYSRISTKKLNELEYRFLGMGPIYLLKSTESDKEYLFATGSRPTMIHYHFEKVVFTPIYAPEATYIAPFPHSNWIILLNDDGWEMGEVSVESNLQIQTHLLGKQPRKVILIPHINKLVLLTYRENDESVGSIQLVDPHTFDSISEYMFDSDEMTSCIHWITFDGDSDQAYLVVGTGISKNDEEECHNGNIHFFKVEEDQQFKLMFSIPVKGAVYDLILHKNKLIVGINGMLSLFLISPGEKSFKQLHTLYMPTTVTQLDVMDDFILAQDFIRSVQIVTMSKDSDQLVNFCGDNTPTWPISSRALDTTTVLSGDSNFNLVLLKRTQMALARGEKPKITWSGQIHWGDQINCIVRKPDDNQTLVFGTSGGAIGVFRTIDGETYDILSKLVTNISKCIPGVGGLEYGTWRQFENDRLKRDCYGFVDGDMLDVFLNLDLETKKKVLSGKNSEPLNLPINMVVEMVKEILNFY